jgi:hypothetical protein
MSASAFLNACAIFCNGSGLLLTVLVYKKPDSRTFLYNKTERPAIAKRDHSRHRLAVAGFVFLGLAFIFQLLTQMTQGL